MREAEMVCSGASAIPPDGDRAVGTTAPAVGNVAPKSDIGLETIATAARHGSRCYAKVGGDLVIRPIFHQDQARIEAHIFIAFLAYCLQVTLALQLKPRAAHSRA